MKGPFSLIIWRPLGDPDFGPIAKVSFDPDVRACSFTTRLPGGFEQLTVELEPQTAHTNNAFLEMPPRALRFAHVELWAGDVLLWEGRMAERMFIGPYFSGFMAEGYGVWATKDNVFQSYSNIQLSGAALLALALGNVPNIGFTLVDASQFIDPGVYHSLMELNYQSIDQVIQQLSKEGGESNSLFDFTCWDSRRVYFTPRTCPVDSNNMTTPHYNIDWDSKVVKLSLDDREAYGGIVVNYTDTGSSTPASTGIISDPTFASTVGFQRVNSISGSNMSATYANSYARTWLAQHSKSIAKGTLSFDSLNWLRLGATGAPVPALFARAGEWIQIGHDSDFLPPQAIIRTTTNLIDLKTQLTIGESALSYEHTIYELRRVAAAIKNGYNPNTAAPVFSHAP